MAIYQSAYTGPEIDEAIGKVSTIEQSVITNTEDISTIEGELDTINQNLTNHIEDSTIHNTIEDIETALNSVYEPKRGVNDNYVSDAEKIVIGNTSGTNSGDETESSIKTKLNITTLSGSNTGDQDLSGLQTKNQYISNTSVSSWVSDTTYTNYLYKANITITGLTSSMLCEVIFSHLDSISGNYSPICVSSADTLTIYSKVNTAITIPTILIQK